MIFSNLMQPRQRRRKYKLRRQLNAYKIYRKIIKLMRRPVYVNINHTYYDRDLFN